MAFFRFRKSRVFSALLILIFLFAQMGLAVPGYAATGGSAKLSSGQSLYKDVSSADPNFIFIKYLNGVGLLKGYTDGSFRSASGLTRAEAAALMVKTAGLKTVAGKTVFKDVSSKHWAAASITAAKNAGLLTGYPNGTFRPEAALTRAEGISLLLKLSKQADPGVDLPILADVTPKHWAARSVAVGLASEMVGLSSDNKRFLPNARFTRGSLARALAVLLTKDPTFYQSTDPQNPSTGYSPVNNTLTNKLSVTKGTPTITRSGSKDAESIKDGMEIKIGDTINTGATGIVDITFPDGTGLRLEENAQFTLKESRGRSYIGPDGSPGIAVEWLGVDLKQGKMFGALATSVEANTVANNTYNNSNSNSGNNTNGKAAGGKARALALGNLSENKVRTAAAAAKPLPWWKQSGVKRTKVKIDMPTGVAAIRGTFWENTVKADGSFTTSLLTGDAEVSSGGQSIDLKAGQRTQVATTGAPPAPPAPLTLEDKKEWVKQKVWAEQRAQEIEAKKEQKELPPPPPAEKPQAPVTPVPPVKPELTPQQPNQPPTEQQQTQPNPETSSLSSFIGELLDETEKEVGPSEPVPEANQTTGDDDTDTTTAPADVTVSTAATDTTGNKITLTFDRAVSDPVGKHSQFTVVADGSPNGVTAVALNTDPKKIDLTLEWPIQYGHTATVGFNASAGTIHASDGGELKSFSEYTVTNMTQYVAPVILPVVSTHEVYPMTTSASVVGEITSMGSGSITKHGFVWDTAPNPTVSLTTKTDLGSRSSIGIFSGSISGLTPGTTYYLRAYAENSSGVTYGNQVTFTTLVATPTVTTGTVYTMSDSASVSGEITSLGSGTITKHGFVWDTSPNPTVSLTTNTDLGSRSTIGIFSGSITGLSPGTTYYVRAYAENSDGVSYGNEVTFTTDVLEVEPVLYQYGALTDILNSVVQFYSIDDGSGPVMQEVYSGSASVNDLVRFNVDSANRYSDVSPVEALTTGSVVYNYYKVIDVVYVNATSAQIRVKQADINGYEPSGAPMYLSYNPALTRIFDSSSGEITSYAQDMNSIIGSLVNLYDAYDSAGRDVAVGGYLADGVIDFVNIIKPGNAGAGSFTGQIYTSGPPYHVLGETVGIRVYDPDMNTTASLDVLSVCVHVYGSSSPGITVTLTETGAGTGEFEGSFTLTGSYTGSPNSIVVVVGDVVEVEYLDALDSSGQVNQERVTKITVTDLAQNVSLTETTFLEGNISGTLQWKAAADQSQITHYAVYFLDFYNNIVGPEIVLPVVANQVYYSQPISAAMPSLASKIGVFSMNANDHYYLSAVAANVLFRVGYIEPTVGSLVYGRFLNTATRLTDGRVLFVGGFVYDGFPDFTDTSEVFNPSTKQFSWAGKLSTPRYNHSAVLLQNGNVLITGGGTYEVDATDTAEVFDPSTGNFTLLDVNVSAMVYARSGHTSTKLNNGSVLLVGGTDINGQALVSAEVYENDIFTSTVNSMVYARNGHTATLLNDGRVLIIGGSDTGETPVNIRTAEIYNPSTRTFSPGGELVIPRSWHTATLLQNGKVLVIGGSTDGELPNAEFWDPATGSFTLADGIGLPRAQHSATLLPDGWVLISGGTNFTEVYVPSLDVFVPGPFLNDSRFNESAVLLNDGTVLIAGGWSGDIFTLPQQGAIYHPVQ